MRKLKKFENFDDGYFIIIENVGGCIDNINLFADQKDANNYVINIIHTNVKEHEGDDYGCKDIFDIDDLVSYWNENHGSEGDDIYYGYEQPSGKVEVISELKQRMEAIKYNL